MRNLKRALSLTLASVMLLGMMVVGSSAAAGYDDVKETDNVEAIEVLQAVGIMVGDERGFGPDRAVNRAEMAVIMGLLLNLDYNYYVATCPFNDVYDWARGWVGACAANGIVSGRGDGVYDPGATVTAVEAASMLMRALGYFKYQSDYANGFEVSTVLQGNNIGIFKGVGSSATEPMTRNQVAQMVLNALKSGMVRADGNTLNYFDTNGNVIATNGKVNYVYVTSNDTFAQAISDVSATSMGSTNNAPIVELGEQLYDGELKLYDYRVDDFGRPARQWEFKGQEIGTYVKKELLKQEYTDEVTGKTLYELLTKNTIDNYDFLITIDGETEENVLTGYGFFTKGNLIRTNTKSVGATGKGVLTQVFVDTTKDREQVYISVINTYLAKATMDYNEKRDEVVYKVWSGDTAVVAPVGSHMVKNTGLKSDITVDGDDFDIKDVKKDDIVLVNVAQGEIKTIFDPEIVSSTRISAFKNQKWVNAGGTQYDYASTAQYDDDVLDTYSNSNMKDVTYNVLLDQYGYLIGIEQNEDPDQYVFITGTDDNFSDLRNKEADMAAIFLDGTMKTIKVDTKASRDNGINFTGKPGAIINTWCKYTVNSSDVYTLDLIPSSLSGGKVAQWAQNVEDAGTAAATNNNDWYANAGSTTPNWEYTIDKGHVSLVASDGTYATNRRVYGNDETVYISVSTDVINTKSDFPQANSDKGNGIGNNAATAPFAADAANYYMTNGTAVQLAAIIDDVDSVTVGVKNVSIKVKDVKASDYEKSVGVGYGANDLAVPKSEIYTLYDEDHYVIAAVVIGEDQGTTAQYAYVHSDDVSMEEWRDNSTSTRTEADRTWKWTRDVIIDGVKTTLTEVSDSGYSKIDQAHMIRGNWYKVSKDADGNVRKVESTSSNPANFDGKYITTVGSVESNYDNDKELTVLSADYTGRPGSISAGLGRALVYEKGTLYTNKAANEGFTVSRDVKVVYSNAAMKQVNKTPTGDFAEVNWFDVVEDGLTTYDGLERALTLIDSDSITAGNGNFYGVLNAVIENGQATSIIIVDTLGARLDVGDKVDDTTPGESARMDVADVQKMLNSNKNVTIEGNWNPADALANDGVPLNIPAGRTLRIKGNLNTGDDRLVITGTGTLIVDKTFTLTSEVSDDISYKVKANKVALTLNQDVTISADMTVDTNLNLSGGANNDLTIESGVTVDVKNKLVNDGNTRSVIVDGTLKAVNIAGGIGSGVTIDVTSTSSLYVTGAVQDYVTVNVGVGSAAGYAEIADVNGTSAIVYINKIVSTKVPEVTTVTEGTVDVTAANTAVEVGTAEANAVLKVSDDEATIIVTEKLDTYKLGIVEGGTLELAAGTTLGTNANVTDANGVELEKVGDGGSMTITPGTGGINNSGATDKPANIPTNEEASADTETKDPITAEMKFVYDEDTFEPYKKTGAAGNTTWQNIVDDGGVNTLPWVWTKVSVPKGSAVTQIKAIKFEIDGVEKTMFQGSENGPVEYKETWGSIDASEAAKAAVFHWEMKKSTDTSGDTLSLDQDTVATGGAVYKVTFEVSITVGDETKTVEVTAEAPYNGPASYEAPTPEVTE